MFIDLLSSSRHDIVPLSLVVASLRRTGSALAGPPFFLLPSSIFHPPPLLLTVTPLLLPGLHFALQLHGIAMITKSLKTQPWQVKHPSDRPAQVR